MWFCLWLHHLTKHPIEEMSTDEYRVCKDGTEVSVAEELQGFIAAFCTSVQCSENPSYEARWCYWFCGGGGLISYLIVGGTCNLNWITFGGFGVCTHPMCVYLVSTSVAN